MLLDGSDLSTERVEASVGCFEALSFLATDGTPHPMLRFRDEVSVRGSERFEL